MHRGYRGASAIGGASWPHPDLTIDPDQWLWLMPVVRPDVIEDAWDDDVDFPALRKAALDLRAFDAGTLPLAWIVAPIAVGAEVVGELRRGVPLIERDGRE